MAESQDKNPLELSSISHSLHEIIDDKDIRGDQQQHQTNRGGTSLRARGGPRTRGVGGYARAARVRPNPFMSRLPNAVAPSVPQAMAGYNIYNPYTTQALTQAPGTSLPQALNPLPVFPNTPPANTGNGIGPSITNMPPHPSPLSAVPTLQPAALTAVTSTNSAAVGMVSPQTPRVLKVSQKTNPKNVAGAIAHISRDGECPAILATGPASVNQATKAIAIARSYLEENKIDLRCYPEFSNLNGSHENPQTGYSFYLHLARSARYRFGPTGVVSSETKDGIVKVSAKSKPGAVAGAIAKRVRAKQPVWVLAVGANSVTHAVKAVTLARTYLQDECIDISFRPEFTRVEFTDGQQGNAIRLLILIQDI